MRAATINYTIRNNKELIFHPLIGLSFGYFFLHPVSMVIYWFEMNKSAFNMTELGKVFLDNMVHSFSMHMVPMSFAFMVLGLIAGVGSGLYYHSIRKKERLLHGKRQLLQQSIPSLIANGENEYVEFKSSLRHDYRQVKTDKNLEQIILKSVAGFLNAKGGILIIGVDDDGKVIGLDNDYCSLKKKNKDGFQQRIILLISNAYGRSVCSNIHVTFHPIGATEICTLYIEPSSKPVYFKEGNRTVFFLRTGNVTNPLTTSETVEYLQSRDKT